MTKWRVLIVDDSSMIRSQLRTLLESHGVDVVEGDNGSEGLWRAREQCFDLVVSDVHMPVMDGLRMISEIRRLDGYSGTPIYVLTTDTSKQRVEDAKRAGATAWIHKPFKPDLLWQAIERALLRVRPEASLRPLDR